MRSTSGQRQMYRELREAAERDRLRRKQLIERIVDQRRERRLRPLPPPARLAPASERARRPD
ncbi:MAG: hypothetical protein ACTHQQ_19085 [Solirubrobacteraceae bacterium]